MPRGPSRRLVAALVAIIAAKRYFDRKKRAINNSKRLRGVIVPEVRCSEQSFLRIAAALSDGKDVVYHPNRCRADFETALKMSVAHLTWPLRLEDFAALHGIGRSASWCSGIMISFLESMYDRFLNSETHMSAFARCVARRAELYSRAIKSPYSGVKAFGTIIGFVDGTLIHTCRPLSGGQYGRMQESMYNGAHKQHGLGFIGVVFPDGLTFLFGPYNGSCNDIGMFGESKVAEVLHTLNTKTHQRNVLYADAGVHSSNPETSYVVVRPMNMVGDRQSDQASVAVNTIMAKLRVAAEWQFSWLKNRFKAVDYAPLNKLSSRPGVRALFASFYLNCMSCVEGGNQSSSYFGIGPPSLEDFLYYYT